MNIAGIFSDRRFKVSQHREIGRLTAEILKHDGKGDAYSLLTKVDAITGKTGLESVAEGIYDADIPFSGGYIFHPLHFHHPWSHRGYLSNRSSADVTARIYSLALVHWRAGKRSSALYQLGRAIHLLQDINIPQHTGITAFKGHANLENWLAVSGNHYLIQNGGYYEWKKEFYHQNGTKHHVSSRNIYDWIDYGSHMAYPLFEQYFADGNYSQDHFHPLAAVIMPNVLRLSAGFVHKFHTDIA